MFELPKSGEKVSLEHITDICKYFGRDALLKRILDDPPPNPFKSDGCSMWFDSWRGIDFYPYCFLHDLEYWVGGTNTDRLVADAQLMIDIAKAGCPQMAEIMFHGVRVGGHERFRRTFSWGFGRRRTRQQQA